MDISTRHLPSIADRTHGDEGLVSIDDNDGEFPCIICGFNRVDCDDEICLDCMEVEL